MILWSSHKLERTLADGTLDSWAKAKYIILPTVLAGLWGPFYVISPTFGEKPPMLNSLYSFVFAVWMAYLTYWGIKKCFLRNKEIDGEAFLERFVILVIPPMIRTAIMMICASIAFLIAAASLRDYIPLLFGRAPIVTGILGVIGTYILYTLTANSFMRLGTFLRSKDNESS